MQITILLASWFSLWLSVWGVFIFLLKRGVNYIQTFRLVVGYFLCFSFLAAYIYKPFLFPFFAHLPLKILPFSLLLLFYLLAFIIYAVGKKIFDKEILEENKQQWMFFATFDNRFLLSKSFDILFQQILLLSLVLFLQNFIQSNLLIILITGIIFGSMHLPMLKTKHNRIAPYFIFFSFLAGVFFSFLILFLPYGFLYSYITHWLFYIFAGIIITRRSSRKRKQMLSFS